MQEKGLQEVAGPKRVRPRRGRELAYPRMSEQSPVLAAEDLASPQREDKRLEAELVQMKSVEPPREERLALELGLALVQRPSRRDATLAVGEVLAQCGHSWVKFRVNLLPSLARVHFP